MIRLHHARRFAWILVLTALVGTCPYSALAQQDPAKPKRVENSRQRVFKGRVIAPVMGYEGAEWLERQDRDETEQPDKVLDALQIQPGSTVADIGAGTGYFSLRLAKRVGTKGKVLATDIQPEMVRLLGENLKKAGIENIEPIQCTITDAKLPPNKVDLALMVDVYHELSDPERTIAQVRRALKRDGRLVLVEYRGEDPRVPIKPEHKMTLRQVRYEIEPMGFRLDQLFEFLVHQHVIVFVKDDAPNGPNFPTVRIPGGVPPDRDAWRAAGFTALLNGSSLDGWDGGPEFWSVEGGIVAARGGADTPAYVSLRRREKLANFELDLQSRLLDSDGAAGVRVRDTRSVTRLTGLEVMIGANQHGAIADPQDRRELHPSSDRAGALVVPGEWNRYTIRCDGPRVTVAVNGVPVTAFEQDGPIEPGVVGLVHHRGDVEFKEIWIKRLGN